MHRALPFQLLKTTCHSQPCMLQKYFLSFADVCHGSSRHQCVFILCNKDAYTMQAASLAREVCSLTMPVLWNRSQPGQLQQPLHADIDLRLLAVITCSCYHYIHAAMLLQRGYKICHAPGHGHTSHSRRALFLT